MKNFFILSCLLLVNFCNASFAQLADSPWPMRGQNLQHTGRGTSIYSASNTVKWKYKTENYVDSSPAIGTDGTVYVGTGYKYLYAVKSDGTLKWKYGTAKWIESSPAIGKDGTVYVGTIDDYLYAIKSDGTLKWKYQTGGGVDSSPAIGKDGTVYVGSDDSYLYAINSNGTLKWKYKTDYGVDSSPAIGTDGTVYVGSWDFYLHAINSNGILKWKYLLGDNVSSPAIDADGTVYVESGYFDGYLYAIKADGNLKWKYKTGGGVDSSPAIDADGTVYVGSIDDYLYAINVDGNLKWKFKTSFKVTSSPAIGTDGTVYVGSGDKNLYAIKADGTLKWKYMTGGGVYSSPAIGTDGTVYVGSMDYYLYAFAPEPFSLSLTSPNGGETFKAGSVKSITWLTSGVIDAKLEYSTNGGISWTTITQNAQYGSYDWTVPDILSSNCLIKISDTSNLNNYDISDAPFSILKPSITVIYPNGGEAFIVGNNINITWSSTTDNDVKIDYTKDEGSTWTILTQSSQSIGTYNWVIQDEISEKCYVRITDSLNSNIYDISDSSFSILSSPISVEKENPKTFKVYTPYPNPFNQVTTISYYIPNPGYVSLSVYSLSGQKVAILSEGYTYAGIHDVSFNGSGLASGLYFYRFESNDFSETGKILLIK